MARRALDLTGSIMAYEEGLLDLTETVQLFADLIKTGLAWRLQGHYGRTCAEMIRQGVIDKAGNITTLATEE